MKNKKLFFKIYLIFIIVVSISIITLVLLGIKERVGYLSDFNLNINDTLYINRLDIDETKQLFTIDNKLDENAIINYIFTNNSITSYSYNFKMKYYDKVFRNSDIYGVYPNLNNLPEYVQLAKMNDYLGTPFGNLVSTKIIDSEKIDNINYVLKIKHNFIYLNILSITIILLITYICYVYKNYICRFGIQIKNYLLKNKILILQICFVITVAISLILILKFLGKKERQGYLSELNLNIDKTLQINGLDINETKQLFTIDNKLDEIAISNFIFTNAYITNYNYDFGIKYYSKIFRNSNIYDVHINTSQILENNDYIKKISIVSKVRGLGNLVSNKIIDIEKIDNIHYLLEVKKNIINGFIISCIIILFFLLKNKYSYINTIKSNIFLLILKYILFISYIIFVIIGIYYHEPWRDEGQAWLISRDLSFLDIFLQTGVEGHPFLFFFILKPFTFLPYYPTLNIINAIFVIIAVYILIFKNVNYNWIIKLSILFSTMILYEYPIIARNYGLSFLLYMYILYLYKYRYVKTTRYIITIGLLMNTTVIGISIGFIESFCFLYKIFSKKNNIFIKKKFKDIIILYLFLLLTLSQILLMLYNRSNLLYFFDNSTQFYISSLALILILLVIFFIFIYLKFNNKLILPNMNYTFEFILKIVLIFVFIRSIRLFYPLLNRHLFLFTLYTIFLLSFYIKSKLYLVQSIIIIYSILIIYYTYGFGFNQYLYDIKYNFSGGKEAAKYIKDNNYDNKEKYIIIVDDLHYLSGSISPYFKEKIIYDSGLDEFITFSDWVKKAKYNNYNNTNFITNINNKIIISLDNKNNNFKYIFLTNFKGGENIFLYFVTNK